MEPEIEVVKRKCAKPEKSKLVWLVNDSIKRCEYKKGRIIEIFTGSDGVVRLAIVKMAHES